MELRNEGFVISNSDQEILFKSKFVLKFQWNNEIFSTGIINTKYQVSLLPKKLYNLRKSICGEGYNYIYSQITIFRNKFVKHFAKCYVLYSLSSYLYRISDLMRALSMANPLASYYSFIFLDCLIVVCLNQLPN